MIIVSDSVQRGIPRIAGTETTVLDVYDAVEKRDLDVEYVAETEHQIQEDLQERAVTFDVQSRVSTLIMPRGRDSLLTR